MDSATIAASVITLVTPYLKHIGEEFAGVAGKYVQGRTKRLWKKLRIKFESDAAAKLAVDDFEKDPDKYREEFEAVLKKQMTQDTQFFQELFAELDDIKHKAPYTRVVQEMKEAEGVVVKARLCQGTVDVKQEIDKAKKITRLEGEVG